MEEYEGCRWRDRNEYIQCIHMGKEVDVEYWNNDEFETIEECVKCHPAYSMRVVPSVYFTMILPPNTVPTGQIMISTVTNMKRRTEMCNYCEREECTLTKEQAITHGPIIESNAMSIMQELDGGIYTYSFKGVPCYNSLSALIPDESEENPHAYMRYDFDEDEGCYKDDMKCCEILNPLKWQTEKEFLSKLN